MTTYTVKGIRLHIASHPQVYPPSEDTFLMLGAIAAIKGRVLELGTGSGIIAVYCASKGARVVCTDINPFAVTLARENARNNDVDLEVVRTDLFEGFSSEFDTIIFNPPYLPTEMSDATDDRWLDASVCGGRDGREHIRQFMKKLGPRLSRKGRAYVLLSSLAGPVDLGQDGFQTALKASCHLNFETLTVHKLTRPQR